MTVGKNYFKIKAEKKPTKNVSFKQTKKQWGTHRKLEDQYRRIHIWIRGDSEWEKREHERKEITQKE